MSPEWPILLISGPTASGKSGLALTLAEHTGACIVNADAMQVYRDLRVVTARPSIDDEARAPHHLYGHVDAGDRYSVGAWMRDVVPFLADLLRAGAPIIVVGGTGLYFEALTEGLADVPPISTETRDDVGRSLERLSPDAGAAHSWARSVDPQAAARVEPNDLQRVRRIVEVYVQTGRTLSDWQAQTQPALAPSAWRGVALMPGREGLYHWIDARARHIVRDGHDEVAGLLARELDPDLPAMKALGAPHLGHVIAGRWRVEEAVEMLARDTRRYAKRQMTWLRRRMTDWLVMDAPDVDTALAFWRTPTSPGRR